MKILIFTAVLLCPAVMLFAQERGKKEKVYSFQVEGSIAKQDKPTKIYLRRKTEGKMIIDSVITPDGRFLFLGNIPEPQTAQLFTQVTPTPENPVGRKEVVMLFLGPGATTVDIKDINSRGTATGTPEQEAFNQLNSLTWPFTKEADEIYGKYMKAARAKDDALIRKYESRLDELNASRRAVMSKYLKDNPHTPIGMYVINQVAGYELDADEFYPVFNTLSKTVRNYPSGKQFEYRLELAKKLTVGNPAIEFSQNDAAGKPVNLGSFKGKYVLVDFWASWCGPCRAENPNVVKAYHKYKEKGFTILGVSFDESKEKWLQAVQDDQLAWTQVSDLKGWGNAVGQLYGIRAIPQNLLLDPQGKIIAKNLRAEALEAKLEELLK